MPFQPARTFSSRPGLIRPSRWAKSVARALAEKLGEPVRRDAERRRHLAGIARDVEDAPALEVRPVGHAPVLEGGAGRLGLEQRLDLRPVPQEELALLPFRVRVLGRVEAAPGMGHLADDVVEGLLGDAAVLGIPRRLPGLEIEERQLGLVVEHLLEVGHEPDLVDRVAVESAAQLVVDAAPRHAGEGLADHLERLGQVPATPVSKEEVEGHRLGELGRPPEPPVVSIELRPEPLIGAVEDLSSQEVGARPDPLSLSEPLEEILPDPGGLAALLAIELGHRLENARKPGHAMPIGRREVGAAVERDALGRHEHRHRPAAVTRHRLDGLHVDRVDVRALLAVDLDVDEPLVHEARDRGILERLALHDVAPVAGRVADGEEDGLVLAASPSQRLLAPGVPVDRVVLVLEEVGARLPREAIGGAGGPRCVRRLVAHLATPRELTGRPSDGLRRPVRITPPGPGGRRAARRPPPAGARLRPARRHESRAPSAPAAGIRAPASTRGPARRPRW